MLYAQKFDTDIDSFAARIAREMKLPDAWISTVLMMGPDVPTPTAYSSRVMQCRDFAVQVVIGEKQTPILFVSRGTL